MVYLQWFRHNSFLKCVLQAEIAKKSIKLLFWRSRLSKVIDFDANRKPVYDFPLVINSNLGPIPHCFWDTATYWLKSQIFPSHLALSFGWSLLNFWKSFTDPKTKNFVVLGCIVFGWSTRTDRIAMAKTHYSSFCCRAQKRAKSMFGGGYALDPAEELTNVSIIGLV